jgi:predicted metalloprotease with PDZ domain
MLAGSLAAQSQLAPIRLFVDETAAPQKILHASLVIPAAPGPLTLFYPKWIPGEHMPDGPVADLAGLKFTAGGKPVPWRRDLEDMFAFHLQVPEGAAAVEVQLDFLLSAPAAGLSGGASATSQLSLLSWNQVLLYPQGRPARDFTYEPSLRLPDGWKFATALPVARRTGNTIEFAPAPLDTLVDSPVLAGAHFRVIPIGPDDGPRHELDLAADSAEALAMPAEAIAHYNQLVAETGALFGSRHYRAYHFLVTLSDDVAHFGLEHHESSDDRVPERTLLDDVLRVHNADLLPHEFTHSWNGKYRRPAGLATPDYQHPMHDDLLWVYEGLTEYLGDVLTARSGLWTPEEFREHLAYVAATLDHRAGRTWRSLQDTADSAQLLYNAPDEWLAWRRSTDFYDEGTLLWLDVDATLRAESHGHRSLNDFCRLFHGGPGGAPALQTYTFDVVVAALGQLVPFDWSAFLTERLTSTSPHAPLGGIEKGGWKLVYNETPNEALYAAEQSRKDMDLSSSLGLSLDDDGTIRDVIPGMIAYEAGMGPAMKIAAVNGRQFSPDVLHEALRVSRTSIGTLDLEVSNGQYFRTFHLDYHGGLRFPHIERNSALPDALGEITKPMAPAGKQP